MLSMFSVHLCHLPHDFRPQCGKNTKDPDPETRKPWTHCSIKIIVQNDMVVWRASWNQISCQKRTKNILQASQKEEHSMTQWNAETKCRKLKTNLNSTDLDVVAVRWHPSLSGMPPFISGMVPLYLPKAMKLILASYFAHEMTPLMNNWSRCECPHAALLAFCKGACV